MQAQHLLQQRQRQPLHLRNRALALGAPARPEIEHHDLALVALGRDERVGDRQVGDEGEDEGFAMVEVGLFAMKRDQINRAILPLKAAGMARYMNENVPGIAVPQDMIDKLAAAAAEGKEKGVKGLPMQLGIEMAAEMIAKIKDEHLCDGVHIMAIGAEKNVPAILDKAGVTI